MRPAKITLCMVVRCSSYEDEITCDRCFSWITGHSRNRYRMGQARSRRSSLERWRYTDAYCHASEPNQDAQCHTIEPNSYPDHRPILSNRHCYGPDTIRTWLGEHARSFARNRPVIVARNAN
jgi:hypothetical protein